MLLLNPVICRKGLVDMSAPFKNEDVEAIFAAWPNDLRAKILFLRALIFEVAANTKNVGTLVETTKWNVPAYLTENPKSGTTIRLEGKAETGIYGLYVPCSTSLIEQCKELYPDVFTFNKNRGLIFKLKDDVPLEELRHFIAMALTYHLKSDPLNISST